ncbi:hypothetical protein [Pyxidicoccus xibeiensis]|uniref:hypothetical protein n=1 Tax=Pyxidicoccus xibeiensis TaxID=2906759 RepID=UPI0020A7D5EF|nr:hypothetical protein [Pyxidicoccus xibeiensis]MCP3142981.1 hypothetical protein [Pyxidicoccus xibeiensis]
MTAYDRYRALLRKLVLVRARHPDGDSPEEDALLDVLDEVWTEMTEGERSAISSERARALGLPDTESHGTDSAPPPQG